MEQNTHTSLNIIRTLDDLKILQFWKIIRDGNVMLLDSNWVKDKEYTEHERSELQEVWYALYDEYYKQTNDSRSKHELKKSSDELILSYRIMRLHKFCELLVWLSNCRSELPQEKWDQMYVDLVNSVKETEPKIKTNIFDEPIGTLEKINRYMASLHNQLKKLTAGKKKSADSAVSNIYTKVAAVGIELGLQLKVEDMSCNEWLAYQSVAAARQRAAKEQQNRKGRK